MRLARRALATTVAALAMATAGVVAATPAAATPEDGKGCVGTPAVPQSYICVISLTPTSAVPSVTTTPINVPVPPVCYFLDCTPAQTVPVPVPGVSEGSGVVAVLWYRGQYTPIAIGTGTVLEAVSDGIDLAVDTLYGTVLPVVDNALYRVEDVLETLPSVDELVYELNDRIESAQYTVQRYVDRVNDIYYDYYCTVYLILNPNEWYCYY